MGVFGPYPARIVSVHDGDTISVDLDLGFGITLNARDFNGHPSLSCRVFGINAPELSTQAGKDALLYALTIINPGDSVTVVSHGWDKYGGRFDGSILLSDGTDFAQHMLDSGHAVPLTA